ncbi:hypothetical protein D3C78_1426460 [compost metagenome]
MAVAHGPAQVALALVHFIAAVELEVQVAHVGVQRGEVALQGGQAADLVQRVDEQHIRAVQLAEVLEIVLVQRGEAAGEGGQEVAHRRFLAVHADCASGDWSSALNAARARSRERARSTIGRG